MLSDNIDHYFDSFDSVIILYIKIVITHVDKYIFIEILWKNGMLVCTREKKYQKSKSE